MPASSRGCPRRTPGLSLLILLVALAGPWLPGTPGTAYAQSTLASIAEAVRGLTAAEGFVPFWYDPAGDRVLLEVPAFDEDVLYYVSAATGAGSVELPLDRGILESMVVHFERAGPKVLVSRRTTDYRALDDAARARNVALPFPRSVLAALPVVAEEQNRVVVDGTALFMRDAAGIRERMKARRMGDFRFDAKRSGFHVPRLGAFPDNTEIETIATFAVSESAPHLDPAIPEPVRSNMREGVLWWNRAFEAAGFRNAIEVRDPGPDMDPMDIRYAWIQWIDRDERGFSSGGTFRDPSTGEILGSKTRMDSHRIRTIANFWESYLAGAEAPVGLSEAQRDFVLARQRLLTAHELGHVLGFSHNFAASINERASVMDYPIARVQVTDGRIDLSEAFQQGVGAYDVYMVRYAYTPFPPEREAAALDALITEMRAEGLIYVPRSDPRWTWYDDRATPTAYLRETLEARRLLIDGFGPQLLQPGEPLGSLRDMRLWMTYLHHRWAVESAVKHVGGLYHEYAVKGDGIEATRPVPASLQREPLALLFDAIAPRELALPESFLAPLTIDPGSNREDMADDYVFDQLRAARIAASTVIGPLLSPDRASRLVVLANRFPDTVTLPEVIDGLMTHTWAAARDEDPRHHALRRVTQDLALDALMILGASEETAPVARAYALDRLSRLAADLEVRHDENPLTQAHYRQSARDIVRYLEDPAAHAPETVGPPWGERPRSRWPQPPGPPL